MNALDAHMGSAGPDDNAAQAGHLIGVNNFGERGVATALSAKNQRLDGDTETFVVHSLRADGFDASEDGTGRGTPIIAFDCHKSANGGSSLGFNYDVNPCLRQNPSRPNAVAFDTTQNLIESMAVRRLTPLECERLQGFPDGWTAITFRGKPAADGPRYRAIGNSMAVPVIRWIGQRIMEVEASVA